MSVIDKVAKRFGYGRIQKQPNPQKRAGWAAAAASRLLADWNVGSIAADSEIRKDLAKLRERSRDLRNNNDFAQKFLTMCQTNIIGESGVNLRVKAKDSDRVQGGQLVPGRLDVYANRVIMSAWDHWCRKENCTVTRKMTWCDVQDVVLETAGTDGECLVRMVQGFDNPFKFAIQLLESDHLDIELNQELKGGNVIKMGVELDQWDAPVAYWLFKKNPNETWFDGSYSVAGTKYYRIPADEIIHPYRIRRIGQTRGVPWMATSMTKLQQLDKYVEAEQIASRVAADKMGFFKATGDVQYNGEDDGLGNKIMSAEAGSFEILPPGLELQTYDPQHPNTAFGDFVKSCLRAVAAGLGFVSYNTLGNDMESVNFASGKLGLMEEREGWKKLQRWFIEHFCDDIFSNWLESAIISNQVPLPMSKFDKFNAAEWRGRRWGYIDPTKETTANVQQLAAGLTSPQRILSDAQEDWETTLEELNEFQDKAKSLGLNIAFGTTPAVAPEPEDASPDNAPPKK